MCILDYATLLRGLGAATRSRSGVTQSMERSQSQILLRRMLSNILQRRITKLHSPYSPVHYEQRTHPPAALQYTQRQRYIAMRPPTILYLGKSNTAALPMYASEPRCSCLNGPETFSSETSRALCLSRARLAHSDFAHYIQSQLGYAERARLSPS